MVVAIHSERTFLICEESGDITGGEFGFYSSDTRLLNRYVLWIDGARPRILSGGSSNHRSSVHYLSTEPKREKREIEMGSIAIARQRKIGGRSLSERIEIESFDLKPCSFTLRLEFDSDFADIFEVKAGRLPSDEPSKWSARDGSITIRKAREGAIRELKISSSKAPNVADRALEYDVALDPRSLWALDLVFEPAFISPEGEMRFRIAKPEPIGGPLAVEDSPPAIETDYDELWHAYTQSLKDLLSLQLKGLAISEGDIVPAAGIPWYLTIFGRDSLIAAYQTIPFLPKLAKGVLRTLAKYQGRKQDEKTGEQPGKIIHELRLGPLAEAGMVPSRFYLTIDATVLYLIVFSEYYRWSGDLQFVKDLLWSAEKALAWIDEFGDLDGDGFVEYTWSPLRELPAGGPIEYTWSPVLGRYNQGWKDSWDAVVFSDGRLPDPPIALCEVQGYVFDAKMRTSELFSVLGMSDRAKSLRKEALVLREKFEKSFWMEDKAYYAEALDKDKRQVDAVTSNAGHLLWSGMIAGDRARLVAERLIAVDMLSGWGIRTMSSKEAAFNPMSYHNGSIWPHDNAIIMNGLLRYGIIGPARELVVQLNDAVQRFPRRTPPELFCGFSKKNSRIPIAYPRSNAPQAWASGAVHLLIRTMLGFEPDAAVKQMSMYPWLIPGTKYLKINRLPIAGSYISLHVHRVRDGFDVEVIDNPANLRIVMPSGIRH